MNDITLRPGIDGLPETSNLDEATCESARPSTAPVRPEHSWWAGRWFRALAQVLDSNRISEGRACARSGRVAHLEVQPGLVLAEVQSSANATQAPYRVRMATVTFTDAQWDRIIALMGQRAIYAAQLINGEMPEDIEAVFQTAGVSLFPASMHDLGAGCTCSEWPSACRHVVAVFCMLGEWIDSDPFLLFTLRGRTKEQIMSALRAQRAGQLDSETLQPQSAVEPGAMTDPRALPADLDEFWRLDSRLEEIQIRISPPEIEAELLKVLGELSFVENQDVRAQLQEIYRRVSERALDLAFQDPAETRLG
ncbi:MAG: SWIM zinc finger family protein [Anaerolineae bacterium]